MWRWLCQPQGHTAASDAAWASVGQTAAQGGGPASSCPSGSGGGVKTATAKMESQYQDSVTSHQPCRIMLGWWQTNSHQFTSALTHLAKFPKPWQKWWQSPKMFKRPSSCSTVFQLSQFLLFTAWSNSCSNLLKSTKWCWQFYARWRIPYQTPADCQCCLSTSAVQKLVHKSAGPCKFFQTHDSSPGFPCPSHFVRHQLYKCFNQILKKNMFKRCNATLCFQALVVHM